MASELVANLQAWSLYMAVEEARPPTDDDPDAALSLVLDEAASRVISLLEENERLRKTMSERPCTCHPNQVLALISRIRELEQDVIAFCSPWAVNYAKDHGFPAGHLHPAHYDILARAGARMTDFTRALLPESNSHESENTLDNTKGME